MAGENICGAGVYWNARGLNPGMYFVFWIDIVISLRDIFILVFKTVLNLCAIRLKKMDLIFQIS